MILCKKSVNSFSKINSKMKKNMYLFVSILKLSFLLPLGIVVFIGLFGTFFHVNSTIRKQIALKVYILLYFYTYNTTSLLI